MESVLSFSARKRHQGLGKPRLRKRWGLPLSNGKFLGWCSASVDAAFDRHLTEAELDGGRSCFLELLLTVEQVRRRRLPVKSELSRSTKTNRLCGGASVLETRETLEKSLRVSSITPPYSIQPGAMDLRKTTFDILAQNL